MEDLFVFSSKEFFISVTKNPSPDSFSLSKSVLKFINFGFFT